MTKPYDFSPQTKLDARFRQGGICACCPQELDDVVEHGHHAVPRQLGAPGQRRDGFLETTDNCVILCDDCHNRVHHDGRFGNGAVASPENYPNSHGGDWAAHNAWVDEIHAMEANYYPQQDAGGGQEQSH